MTTSALTVRPLGREDETAVLDLLAAALGAGPTGARDRDFFTWKHHRNPFGTSPGLVAVHDERIVGVRLFLRWRLQAAGRELRAVRAVDTATHPDFQGQGIFGRLTRDLLHRLESAGEVDLVFNTPNANSRPGYLKMGWHAVGTLPVRVCPLRPLRLLRGARRAAGTTASARPSAERRDTAAAGVASAVAAGSHAAASAEIRPLPVAALPTAREILASRPREVMHLLAAAAPTPRLHTPLSGEYLRWRYEDVPGLDYRCVLVESAGVLSGIGFGRLRWRGPLAEFTLGDVLVAAGDVRSARRVLAAARHSGADHVAVHAASGTELAQAATGAAYLPVPRYGVGLVANARRETPLPALRPESWRLSLGDLEVF